MMPFVTVASRAPPAMDSETNTTASSAMSGRPCASPGSVRCRMVSTAFMALASSRPLVFAHHLEERGLERALVRRHRVEPRARVDERSGQLGQRALALDLEPGVAVLAGEQRAVRGEHLGP